jgi:hypothetical protein
MSLAGSWRVLENSSDAKIAVGDVIAFSSDETSFSTAAAEGQLEITRRDVSGLTFHAGLRCVDGNEEDVTVVLTSGRGGGVTAAVTPASGDDDVVFAEITTVAVRGAGVLSSSSSSGAGSLGGRFLLRREGRGDEDDDGGDETAGGGFDFCVTGTRVAGPSGGGAAVDADLDGDEAAADEAD